MVHIGDAADKEKIKILLTKDLVKVLQAEAKEIQEMSRLISSNIKIYAKLAEAKKALEKKTEWTQKKARSSSNTDANIFSLSKQYQDREHQYRQPGKNY